jgi:hypothetical protein
MSLHLLSALGTLSRDFSLFFKKSSPAGFARMQVFRVLMLPFWKQILPIVCKDIALLSPLPAQGEGQTLTSRWEEGQRVHSKF